MIPKKIHYCWFGGNPLPPLAEKCLASWVKYCPDYEIIRWDESNYDCNKHPYMYEAYKQKKFAFVADYARMDIICKHGGIYLDTDVELLKSLDELLDNDFYIGFESRKHVASGLGFGAVKNHIIPETILNNYDAISKVKDFSFTPCPRIETACLKKWGLVEDIGEIQSLGVGISIYPVRYFCPVNMDKEGEVEKDSYSIHHYSSTWVPVHWKIIHFVEKYSKKFFGTRFTEVLRKIKRFFLPPPGEGA